MYKEERKTITTVTIPTMINLVFISIIVQKYNKLWMSFLQMKTHYNVVVGTQYA
jgi:hypothetical protein